ncbi:MAG: hypothetical protein WDN24_12425 [Sphingomonas sp.]
MRNAFLMVGLAGLMLTACGNKAGNAAAPEDNAATADNASAAGEPCADDGDRLPITGLCAGRAVNYLNIAGGELPEPPDGCEWVVQETPFATQVLLYRALKCGSKTTKLAFAGGAGLAELSYETAAYGDTDGTAKGQVLVRVGSIDGSDRTAGLLKTARAAIEDPAEKAGCSVRNAKIESWPEDALVVDVSAAEAAKAPPDEPRAACGPFGFNGDEASYWRVFQGHSWFFQLGQDLAQIDPGSFTLMAKDEKGDWGQVE